MRKMNRKSLAMVALAAALVCCTFASQAGAADFVFDANNAGGVSHEQRWSQPGNWVYVSGVDDGIAGIPDGADTFTIDRNPYGSSSSRLANSSMPTNHSVAKITGTGAPGNDIVLKMKDVTIGDLELLASASAFQIYEERDCDLTINGVISGAGNLELSRAGGFCDGVTQDEIILITGANPNTITGEMRLVNLNAKPIEEAQPSFWVADKVGAFGQTSKLTLESAGNAIASLQLTANTAGGEGAIDDDATDVYLGNLAVLDVADGVDEFIASGKLFTNLDGSGYVAVPDGIYDSSAAWVTGAGTVTVGVPEPATMGLLAFGALAVIRRRRRS